MFLPLAQSSRLVHAWWGARALGIYWNDPAHSALGNSGSISQLRKGSLVL